MEDIFAKRAEEKRKSREEDARALAAGEITREELRKRNGHFAFKNVRIRFGGAKPLR